MVMLLLPMLLLLLPLGGTRCCSHARTYIDVQSLEYASSPACG
jgi:hypothetical protein